MICDFSNSRLGSMEDASLFGSYPWMARELFLSDESESLPYTKKSDVWSFGMVVYVGGHVPCSQLCLMSCHRKSFQGRFHFTV